ncbi:hypothetical protein ACET3Z_023031 [Daucus carota]
MAHVIGKRKRFNFCINDHIDILIEILKRLDDRSLGVAASVCRLWCSVTRNDSLWEHLCFRNMSPMASGVRPVVVALGGYRKLYMACVRPVLSRLKRRRGGEAEMGRRVWSKQEIELWLSLFCVEYYERRTRSEANLTIVEAFCHLGQLIYPSVPIWASRDDCLHDCSLFGTHFFPAVAFQQKFR